MKVRGLWGLEIKPKKTRAVTVDGSFKITMASISSFLGPERTSVYMEFQDTRFLLCSLIPEKIEQHVIDITCLKGEKIVFRSAGPNGVHLMGNYVSQDDSESESDEEEDIEKEVNNIDIADTFGGSVGRSVRRSVKNLTVDSDNDLSLDSSDVLDHPDLLTEIVSEDNEFDVGYICNFLETTFGSNEPDLNNNSNISDPVTADPFTTTIFENADKSKLSRKETTKNQERVTERLEVEKLEVEQRVTVEAENVETEKSKAEKLKADQLITEKLRVEKLKAEKRVPKKRVPIKQGYAVPKAVELVVPIPKNIIGSRDIIAQVVNDHIPKRASRSKTKKLYEERMKLVNQSTEAANILSESNNDQIESNDVPRNDDTNWTAKTEISPSKKARNSKVKNRSANSSVKQSPVEQSPVEQSPVEQSPVEQSPLAESLLKENSPVQRKSRQTRAPSRYSSTVSNASKRRIPISSRTRSKSPVAQKVLDNIPVESISAETNEETDVKKPNSKTNSKSKKPPKKRPAKETPVEHIEEVDSIAPSTETTPTKNTKRRRRNASKEKNTSSNLVDEQAVADSGKITTSEKTDIEPMETEQIPSKKINRSKNKRKELVKQIEKTVSQEEHIQTVSSELTNTDALLDQVDQSTLDKQTNEESYSELINIANIPRVKKEYISKKKIKSLTKSRRPAGRYMKEIPVEETSSNEPTPEIVMIEESCEVTKKAKSKKAYRNKPTEEGTEQIEAEIPSVETMPEETKVNKKPSSKRKRVIEDVSQEAPTENDEDSAHKDELKLQTISYSSLENKRIKVGDALKETVNEDKSTYSFDELLRRERERKKLAKLARKNDKQKKREAKSLRKKEAGDST